MNNIYKETKNAVLDNEKSSWKKPRLIDLKINSTNFNAGGFADDGKYTTAS